MPWNAIARAIGIEAGGGSVRDALSGLWARLTRDRAAERTPGYRTVAFTIAVTTLAAKMAKADGVALPVEERAFARVFNIPADEKANFGRLFDLAAQDIAGYEIYASKIARLLADEPEMLRALLECLFHVAAADGVLHPDEDTFLSVVAEKFGLSRGEFLISARRLHQRPVQPLHDPRRASGHFRCRAEAAPSRAGARASPRPACRDRRSAGAALRCQPPPGGDQRRLR